MSRLAPVTKQRLRPAALLLILLTGLAGVPERASAQTVTPAGETSNRDLFADFLHNAVMGKFQRADAFAQKLLANNPDPLEVLEYADQNTNSLKTLILLVNNIQVSQSARAVLDLIHKGELLRRQDPERINENISKLGGDPQNEFYAINRLTESGEYAVPWLIRALQDPQRAALRSRIIRMLPRMGKEAVNPLVIALSMDDDKTRQFVVRALGEIGYPQAVPYLLAVMQEPDAGPELKEQVEQAILQISTASPSVTVTAPGEAFLHLAEQYYADHGSVRADPRNDFANVWYWQEGELRRIEVPREIFNEIMAMRCCQNALRLAPQQDRAIGLWLAANIRREAELGLNVESPEPAPASQADPTRPENFPRSAYFARAAGARYCHMVLELAMRDHDAKVALGAIAALRLVAGATNLIGTEDFKQPLAQALTFPNQIVRIKAGLALAHALPAAPFAGSDRVVPVLVEALGQSDRRHILVIEPNEQNLNRVMNALRSDDVVVIGESQPFDALERARHELPSVHAVIMASDVTDPGLASAIKILRDNHLYAMTPVVLLTKKGSAEQADTLAKADELIRTVVAGGTAEQLNEALADLAAGPGNIPLDAPQTLTLALDAAEALRKIAFSHSAIYRFNLAEGALIEALSSQDERLQIAAAEVLALSASSAAQEAITYLALDSQNSESLRLAAFDALSDSAKTGGNLLSERATDALIDMAMHESNLILRSAAGQALGALDRPSNKAGQIIGEYDRG